MRQTALFPEVASSPHTPPDTPPHTPHSPPPRFDRIARPYRWLEYLSFGPLLQRTRIQWLSAVVHCRQALVLGDGDGRFTAALLAANPHLRIHAVDASAAMLSLLRSRCASDSRRVTTQQADLRAWQPTAGARYDLVATHFFLDCLTTAQAASLAQRLAPALSSEATWLVSDFAVPPTRFGRFLAAPIVALLYRAFALITGLSVRKLPDHAAALALAGWRLGANHTRAGGLLFSQLWKLSQG